MGSHQVKSEQDGALRRRFMRSLLNDLRALEQMIAAGMIESGIRRIGAEQEMFLVDRNWRPASAALQILEDLDDPSFTTELGLFNLELNLPPLKFGGDCLSRLENHLREKLTQAEKVAERRDLGLILAGILPTLRQSDLTLENMTPMPRYFALNEAMSSLRGGAYEFHIRGLDELLLKHDSVMLEACNASFQVHFQVSAEEFPDLYNIAQLVAAPVLAAGTNSPVLFGRQLWRETRIALFQQAVDTRSSMDFLRERSPRVTFGSHWVRDSVVELFQEDISRFRALVSAELEEDSLEVLEKGGVPKLKALSLHNGTVYRWNRACFGVKDDVAHLRIENRVLPSGPTVLDETANAAFWFGMIAALYDKFGDITEMIPFEDAKMNFTAAARLGLGAQFVWFQGETLPASTLICDRLVPLAAEGLKQAGIDDADAQRYLGVIERRVSTHRTGSQWLVGSLAGMRGQGIPSERLSAVTAAMARRQREGTAVSEWEPAKLEETGGWKHNFLKIEQYMTTDLFTVSPDEPLDLVASLMEWERIRHVPVEDAQHRLVGLVTYRTLIRLLSRGHDGGTQKSVAEVMIRDPYTISPDASTLTAISVMREKGIGCLPVVKGERLVGVVTERDLMNVAAELLRQQLEE